MEHGKAALEKQITGLRKDAKRCRALLASPASLAEQVGLRKKVKEVERQLSVAEHELSQGTVIVVIVRGI